MSERQFKYYDVIACLFVAVLIVSNVASSKINSVGGLVFDGGTVLFPIAYIFDDILTEVYGYAKSRRVIWLGFCSLVFMSLTFWVVQVLPASPNWPNQAAYAAILGLVPRIVLGSITAYWCGEFLNSYVLAKMKLWTGGRYLWTRTIGSTLAGELADSVIFSPIVFYGTMPLRDLANLMVTIYVFKVLYEIAATPFTYKLVAFLKRAEQQDYFDHATDFSPFSISEKGLPQK